MDLSDISSNILLIGLVLVSLCCLYLLFSNFSKVREIEDLKQRVEDLKKIFINQQSHNEEVFSKINTVLYQSITGTEHGTNKNFNESAHSLDTNLSSDQEVDTDTRKIKNSDDINLITAKEVEQEVINEIIPETNLQELKTVSISTNDNLTPSILENNNPPVITITKEGHQIPQLLNTTTTSNNLETHDDNTKNIPLDLHDLDELDNLEDKDSVDEFETQIQTKENTVLDDDNQKPDIFSLDVVNNEIFDDIEDALSIATEPIGDFNDVINGTTNFNLDDIKDLDDLDKLELDDTKLATTTITTTITTTDTQSHNLETVNKSMEEHQNEKQDENLDTISLDELLNGSGSLSNTKKHIEQSHDYYHMSIKQLKELAKSRKLKTTGTKNELIQLLSTTTQ